MGNSGSSSSLRGPAFAFVAAALFGASAPIAKLLVGELGPLWLAGLLYCGCGLGLILPPTYALRGFGSRYRNSSSRTRLRLAGAIIAGGVMAPIALAFGLAHASAFSVSALLNIELPATALIAATAFGEHVSARSWFGQAAIVAGALLLSIQPGGFSLSVGALAVAAASILWALDNNFTRDLEELPAPTIAAAKGLVAGFSNVMLAMFVGLRIPTISAVGGALAIGVIGYGVSLTLFIRALRSLGAARASSFFATAPFVGMVSSLVALKERPSTMSWIGAATMAAGVAAIFFERHEHLHAHEPLRHRHLHKHDIHHAHGHEPQVPHEHEHTHAAVAHSHAHWPDLHHRDH
ncbi:MAG: EamA family transporter [Elusimicrobia bacterium]|nr:EamA family transporter [Elusimicrobiota bacterium]